MHSWRRVANALLLTAALGLVLVGVIGLLSLGGDLTDFGRTDRPVAVVAVLSAIGSTILLWLALAVLCHEWLAARADSRTRGTAIPAFLGGLATVTGLAFLVMLYRGLYYGLVLIGWRAAAAALVDPFVAAAINVLVLLFAVATLALVAHAPVRALIRATAARWRARHAARGR